MFDRWLKKEKPNIYLGNLAVTSEDYLAKIENVWRIGEPLLEDHLRAKLKDIFCLDPIPLHRDIQSSDLGLDVVIVTVRGGEMGSLGIDSVLIPVIWRPRIKLVSRLYNLKTDQTMKSFQVSHSVTWQTYMGQLFSFKSLCRSSSIYDLEQMEDLLCQACLILLNKMRDFIQ
ncbi:hypothetical protein [Photobacterium leiognathi]|uniref:hypothetical protein n=1 Tax=Photobacterium leiognathi TaxID=553611 RepID=UPI0027373A9C|nr:hypothetical protein [Photobacterium leiognathi]